MTERMRRLEPLIFAGMSHAGWYQDVRKAAVDIWGADADDWLSLFALTSMNASVAANVTLATKAMGQLLRCEPFDGYLSTVAQSLEDYRNGLWTGGRKITNFRANLLGNLEQVTVDRWIVRAQGGKRAPKTAEEYSSYSVPIRMMAQKLGMAPAEAQAAVWAGTLLDAGVPVVDVASEIRRPRQKQFEWEGV